SGRSRILRWDTTRSEQRIEDGQHGWEGYPRTTITSTEATRTEFSARTGCGVLDAATEATGISLSAACRRRMLPSLEAKTKIPEYTTRTGFFCPIRQLRRLPWRSTEVE